MRFTNALKLIAIVTHVADARTCCLHPASATHRYMRDYPAVFARFLERKAEIVEKYGLDAARPQWRENSNWAGLFIAIGNEYARSSTKKIRARQKAVEAICALPEMKHAIETLTPEGLSPNKQLVAWMVRGRHFFLLTQMYRLKNRI